MTPARAAAASKLLPTRCLNVMSLSYGCVILDTNQQTCVPFVSATVGARARAYLEPDGGL